MFLSACKHRPQPFADDLNSTVHSSVSLRLRSAWYGARERSRYYGIQYLLHASETETPNVRCVRVGNPVPVACALSYVIAPSLTSV